MKTKFKGHGLRSSGIQIIAAVALLLAFYGRVSTALGQGATAFTYQGQLLSNGTNVEGTNRMVFTLYSSASGTTSVGGPTTNIVAVTNGLFTVNLDFGAGPFNGSARWLDIGILNNTANGPTNVELSPRTQILPTPYATFAAMAATANTASNVMGASFGGSFTGNGAGLTNVGVSLQMEVFSSPGTSTFVVPTNVSSVIVEAWGGGGGGGSGSSSFDSSGGGGGAGGYAKVFFEVTPGANYQILVGAGGVAGGAGGSSSFGGETLVTGGVAGNAGGSGLTVGGAGGSGLTESSTISAIKGGTGKYGTVNGGGDGGSAGGGGAGGLGNLGDGAEAGHAPGGGGGGGSGVTTTTTGAAGGSGEVIVYY
jgi:hypothetical protein